MTDLQKLYADLRGQRFSHVAAVRVIARDLELDVPTVKRVLERAAGQDRKKARRVAVQA